METCKLCLKPEKFCTCINAHTKHHKHNEFPLKHPEYAQAPVQAPVAAPVEVQPPPLPPEDLISGSGNVPWQDEKQKEDDLKEKHSKKHKGHHKSKR